MKKSKIIIGLLAITLLATGCGPKTPEEALQKAFEETEKASSVRTDVTLEVGVKTGGVTVSLTGNATMELKQKNENVSLHATMNMEADEEKINMDAYYTQTNDKDGVFYAGINDEWIKGALKDLLEENEITFDENTNIDLKFKEVKEVSSENGITLYEAIIDKEQIKTQIEEKVKEALKEAEIDETEIDLSGFHYDFDDIVIKVSVNKKNLITKMEMNVPVTCIIDMQEERNEFTITLNLNMEFSKYNEIEEIVVPEEVKEKATDIKEMQAKQYVESYVYEIGWDLWENPEKDNQQYTDTTLEYEGPQPSKVDVLVEDEEVISGVIEIDGYTATYENGEMVSFEKTK